ncbi:ParA family protein [Pseudoalteromonas citrea]|nr:AAA family ATPase [Pseudoalteromonas citrea]
MSTAFRLAEIPPQQRAKIMVVANRKGGVGKTTLVSFIAEAIALWAGKKVLIVDTDKQCNLGAAYGVIENRSQDVAHSFAGQAMRGIQEPIIHPEYYDEDGEPGMFAVRSSSAEIMKENGQDICPYGTYIQPDSPHLGKLNPMNGMLDIIPGHSEELNYLHTHADKYPARKLYEKWESWLIDYGVVEGYDLIIFDTPPLDAELNEALFQLADHVVIPVQPAKDTLSACNTITMSCIAANMADNRIHQVTTLINPLNSGNLTQKEQTLLDPIYNYAAFGTLPKGVMFPRSRIIQERRDIEVPAYLDPESFESLNKEEKKRAKPPMSSLIWGKKSDPARQKLFTVVNELHNRFFGEPLPLQKD